VGEAVAAELVVLAQPEIDLAKESTWPKL